MVLLYIPIYSPYQHTQRAFLSLQSFNSTIQATKSTNLSRTFHIYCLLTDVFPPFFAGLSVPIPNNLAQLSPKFPALPGIVDEDFLQLHRLFVCLLASAEDCQRIWDSWRPRKLLSGAASATWRDTIDAGSSRLVPRLKSCWNPMRLDGKKGRVEVVDHWNPLRSHFEQGLNQMNP